MDGRPLTNEEFWQQLVARNCGRTDPFRHRNKLALLLAGIAGLRIRADTDHYWFVFFANRRTARVCCATRADN